MSSWRMWFVKEQENQTIRQKVQGENFSRECYNLLNFLHYAALEKKCWILRKKIKVGKLSTGKRAFSWVYIN